MALKTLFQDIMWNLNTLSSIDNHQTLLVTGDKLNFDTRFFQSIRRALSEDGRKNVLNAIEKTLYLSDELLSSYQHSHYLCPGRIPQHEEEKEMANHMLTHILEIESKKEKVIEGLEKLATFERYQADASFQISISNFKNKIHQLYLKCVEIRHKYNYKVSDVKTPPFENTTILSLLKQNSAKLSSPRFTPFDFTVVGNTISGTTTSGTTKNIKLDPEISLNQINI